MLLYPYVENLVWDLVSAPIYSDKKELHVSTFVKLVMKRKPLYHIFNIILPPLVIGLLNVFVFLLPADSGERVGFSTTM